MFSQHKSKCSLKYVFVDVLVKGMMFMKSAAWILYGLELAWSSGKKCTHPVQTKLCFEMTYATHLALLFSLCWKFSST